VNFDLDLEIVTRIICDADYGHECNLTRRMFTIQDMINMAGDASCFVPDAERNLIGQI